MGTPGEISTPETRRLEARKLAAEALIFDFLSFVEDTAANSADGEFKVRAKVLASRVDIETDRFVRQIEDGTFCGEHRVLARVCGCGIEEG